MRLLPPALLCVLAVCAIPGSVVGATFLPAADAFVDSAKPDNNYGAAGALGVAAAGKPKGEFDSFLRFDLSGLTENAGAISLQLTAAFPMNPIFNAASAGSFSIRWLRSDSFVEGSGTPNVTDVDPSHVNFTNASRGDYFNAADELLGTFSFNGATSGTFSYDLSLTPGFLADVQAHGLVTLYLSAADANVAYLFNSGSFMGDPATKPMLSVQVPEPCAAFLLLAGAAAMTTHRKLLS